MSSLSGTYPAHYTYFSQALEAEIDKLRQREPKGLYEPVIYTLEMGGKRLRPVLLLMAYHLYASDSKKVVPAAIAIEMFHNFTLLHDDIMDQAELRRNKKTVHIQFSDNAAILSGDAMSILSYEYVTQIDSPRYAEILKLYTQTALQICEGQQYDMEFETRPKVSTDEYIRMIGLKTAVLLAASLKIGALVANAPIEDADHLYKFGYNLGLAFQLQDDLLDTFGNQDDFGKAIGGDIAANKKTYLAITAFELADTSKLAELENWYGTTVCQREEKIAAVKAIFTSLGVGQIARDKMENYYQEALRYLDQVSAQNEKKIHLLAVAQDLMLRKK